MWIVLHTKKWPARRVDDTGQATSGTTTRLVDLTVLTAALLIAILTARALRIPIVLILIVAAQISSLGILILRLALRLSVSRLLIRLLSRLLT
jgi:hypothetical protein